jgi:hypothetical protein
MLYGRQMRIIDDFMIMSGLLNDDIDLICNFIEHHIPKKIKKYKRSKIKRYIENANYDKIEQQINYALDLPIYQYTNFKIFYTNET